MQSAIRLPAWLLTLAFAALLLAIMPFTTISDDEGFYLYRAQLAWQGLQDPLYRPGDFALGGHGYLYNWVYGATQTVFGQSFWLARLTSVAFGVAAFYYAVKTAQRLFGPPGHLVAGLLLAAHPTFVYRMVLGQAGAAMVALLTLGVYALAVNPQSLGRYALAVGAAWAAVAFRLQAGPMLAAWLFFPVLAGWPGRRGLWGLLIWLLTGFIALVPVLLDAPVGTLTALALNPAAGKTILQYTAEAFASVPLVTVLVIPFLRDYFVYWFGIAVGLGLLLARHRQSAFLRSAISHQPSAIGHRPLAIRHLRDVVRSNPVLAYLILSLPISALATALYRSYAVTQYALSLVPQLALISTAVFLRLFRGTFGRRRFLVMAGFLAMLAAGQRIPAYRWNSFLIMQPFAEMSRLMAFLRENVKPDEAIWSTSTVIAYDFGSPPMAYYTPTAACLTGESGQTIYRPYLAYLVFSPGYARQVAAYFCDGIPAAIVIVRGGWWTENLTERDRQLIQSAIDRRYYLALETGRNGQTVSLPVTVYLKKRMISNEVSPYVGAGDARSSIVVNPGCTEKSPTENWPSLPRESGVPAAPASAHVREAGGRSVSAERIVPVNDNLTGAPVAFRTNSVAPPLFHCHCFPPTHLTVRSSPTASSTTILLPRATTWKTWAVGVSSASLKPGCGCSILGSGIRLVSVGVGG